MKQARLQRKEQGLEEGTQATGTRARLRLRVTAAAEKAVRAGHPWVYADSVRDQNREGETGELAVVYDRRDRFLALAMFDVESPIRLRVLLRGKPAVIDREWWSARLAQAVDRRNGLFDHDTTGYRCINGDSEGWPGLALDRYGDTLVVKLYTAAWIPGWREACRLFAEQFQAERIVLRLSRNIQAAATAAGLKDGEVAIGTPAHGPVVFLESGLRFEADVVRGQKTGFFLDQRENRRAVEKLAQGRRVLNAFSFSGGFSVYAARGGALSATDLDISAHALAGGRRNAELNRGDAAVARCRREWLQADAMEWMRDNARGQFDLVILDPPSFAKRESERQPAIRAYARLAALGIACLAPGGMMIACSCSAHVSEEEFFEAITRSAGASKRRFELMRKTGHAPDHPATFAEARYLKAAFLKFGV